MNIQIIANLDIENRLIALRSCTLNYISISGFRIIILSLAILFLVLACSENSERLFNVDSDVVHETPHYDFIAPIFGEMKNITLMTNKLDKANHHAIVIDVSDNKTSNEDLYVNAFSSNQTVIANSQLALSFDSKKRVLLVTPMATAVGVTNISLIATDQAGNYATQDFDLNLKQSIQSSLSLINNILMSSENAESVVLDGLNIGLFEARDNEQVDWYRLAEEHVMLMEAQQ